MEASALQAPLRVRRISLSAPLLRLRSDDQLVALFRAGDEDAFRVIHDRYRQRLFAYTRQMLAGSRQDAEDALQDVFLRAYASLRADERPVALRAWLYRVAHNRCIDQLRRPLPPSADLFEMSRSPLPDPLAETERREDLRRLIEDVRRLPEQQRSVLLMREIDGMSYSDLADAHGVTVPAIKSLLVRARIGLVKAAEARDTTCREIRADLALAHGRGVRANGRARRHLRDCEGCREYRRGLRQVQRDLAALVPGGGAGVLAKLGVGGGGAAASGTAAGGGAATGGTLLSGSAATLTAAKVCAVVCSVAVTAGGAVEVQRQIDSSSGHRSAMSAPARSAPVPTPRAPDAVFLPARQAPELVRRAGAPKPERAKAEPAPPTSATTNTVDPSSTTPPVPTASSTPDTGATGGTQAPTSLADEPSGTNPAPAAGTGDGSSGPVSTARPGPTVPAAGNASAVPTASAGSSGSGS